MKTQWVSLGSIRQKRLLIKKGTISTENKRPAIQELLKILSAFEV